MKKYKFLLFISCVLSLAGCYNDDSRLASDDKWIGDIVIEKMDAVNAIAYSTVLDITPTVNGYADNQLTYAWYIYGGEFSKETQDGYRTHPISDKKTLAYKVDLKAGDYTLVFEATEPATGYAVTSEVSLKVSTLFSQGFYILKETAEGDTELDLYNAADQTHISDILASTQGEPMPGAPRFMSVVYGQAYIDPETTKSAYATGLFITSGQHEFSIFRTNDFLKIFDRSNLLYEEMPADEVPYTATTAMYNFYFSSKGVRTGDTEVFGGEFVTGKLGYPMDEGSSQFVQACDGNGFLYWNEQKHRLMYTNGSNVVTINYLNGQVPWDNLHAVTTGWNHLAGENTMWYLLEDTNKQRYLVVLNKKHEIISLRPLNSGSHLAQADVVAGNALSAYCIYAVHNNQLYSYSLDENGSESAALVVTGLPTGEKITYLSDVFFSKEFDYIVIGTQNGNEYALYMYEIKGGQPYGAPVHTIKGTGKVNNVRYVSQTPTWSFSPNYYAFTIYASLYGMGPDYPY